MTYKRFCPTTLNLKTHPHLKFVTMCWEAMSKTGVVYEILYDKVKKYEHLRINRVDNQPIHNYMDMQEIKNDLFGEGVVAVEVYPAASSFKDGSNTYHLWTWEGLWLETPNLLELYQYIK
jgi:hypothetical protein